MSTPLSPEEVNERVARKLGVQFLRHADGTYCKSNDAGCYEKLPDYSRSIEAAWEIVEFVKEKWLFQIQDTLRQGWICTFYDRSKEGWTSSGYVSANADTAPMAICLAYLKLP